MTVSFASVVPVETSSALSSSTRTDPPVSDTGSLNVRTTSVGATSSISPSAGLTRDQFGVGGGGPAEEDERRRRESDTDDGMANQLIGASR